MEKSFDFGALLKKNEKKHKSKPTQFVSVAGGVQKRLDANIKNRKSTRLTAFDSVRNLPRCESPPPVPDAKMKGEHRRQQLEKWKAEKEQKKKELAAQKKKPFIAGVPQKPLKFEPPPPPPTKPSTSGRVTRSQTKNASVKPKPRQSPVKITPKPRTQSFAPKNAVFKAPEIKNLVKLPTLAPISKTKTKKASLFTFDPVVPNAASTTRQMRSRPLLTRQNATETKLSNRKVQVDTRSTRGKPKPSPKKLAKNIQSSSSGSDIEARNVIQRVKTPRRKPVKEPKALTPKMLAICSTSEEKSSDTSGSELAHCKSNVMIGSSQSSSDKPDSMDPSSTDEQATIVMIKGRKSLPKNFSPHPLRSSSSDKLSSDLDVHKSPVIKLKRKSLPATPKNRIPKSESSSEEKLRSPKSPIEVSLTPEQMESAKISPCVTMSRGKDNARKEMKWKINEGLLDADASDMESIDHFRKQLSSEIARITEMCDAWDKIFAQTVLPESVQEAVLAAVGQARLLMSQKLQQFSSLVERCAAPEPGTALVTPADLHGFWDMVFMQVENVDMRFKKLEELRARGWQEDKPVVKVKKAAASKPAPRRAHKAASSMLKDVIAAARKAKKTQLGSQSSSAEPTPPSEGEKSFDAGFFTVRSPVRSPVVTTPARNNLLKAVLSSEAKKASNSKNSTPFAMLRASMLGKSVEYDGVAILPQTPQMTPVNLYATPGRSILKSNNINAGKSANKSIKVVLFDDSDTDTLEQSFITLSDQNDVEAVVNTKELPKDNVVETSTQNEKENSPVVENVRTRSQRKSGINHSNVDDSKEVKTPRRSSRKKKEPDTEEAQKTPIRQSSRRKTKDKELEKSTEVEEKSRKRSTRKKALQEVGSNVIEETIPTPKRSSRRSKALAC